MSTGDLSVFWYEFFVVVVVLLVAWGYSHTLVNRIFLETPNSYSKGPEILWPQVCQKLAGFIALLRELSASALEPAFARLSDRQWIWDWALHSCQTFSLTRKPEAMHIWKLWKHQICTTGSFLPYIFLVSVYTSPGLKPCFLSYSQPGKIKTPNLILN